MPYLPPLPHKSCDDGGTSECPLARVRRRPCSALPFGTLLALARTPRAWHLKRTYPSPPIWSLSSLPFAPSPLLYLPCFRLFPPLFTSTSFGCIPLHLPSLPASPPPFYPTLHFPLDPSLSLSLLSSFPLPLSSIPLPPSSLFVPYHSLPLSILLPLRFTTSLLVLLPLSWPAHPNAAKEGRPVLSVGRSPSVGFLFVRASLGGGPPAAPRSSVSLRLRFPPARFPSDGVSSSLPSEALLSIRLSLRLLSYGVSLRLCSSTASPSVCISLHASPSVCLSLRKHLVPPSPSFVCLSFLLLLPPFCTSPIRRTSPSVLCTPPPPLPGPPPLPRPPFLLSSPNPPASPQTPTCHTSPSPSYSPPRLLPPSPSPAPSPPPRPTPAPQWRAGLLL
ncbi:hypothetical protein C7M84_008533 [Penaeus vannamei]|uniref:Uncharacterized protein n=1 Tax=Penaeus vannamei TaxID=6689 RepID=A0A3R7MCU0_PENVA|nr:hypothetical protein C7M84_008533 [Penaeus vannamei]